MIEMEFGLLVRLVSVMNLILYLVHSIFKGENPNYVISIKKIYKIGLYPDIYLLISFKLSRMIGTIKVCVCVCVISIDLFFFFLIVSNHISS